MDGRDLALSIDSRVQYIAFSALKAAVDRHNAKAGAALVLDVHTGEVLALANWPTFDPNLRGRLSGDSYTAALPVGETIDSAMVGVVEASNNEKFKPGDRVTGGFGNGE